MILHLMHLLSNAPPIIFQLKWSFVSNSSMLNFVGTCVGLGLVTGLNLSVVLVLGWMWLHV